MIIAFLLIGFVCGDLLAQDQIEAEKVKTLSQDESQDAEKMIKEGELPEVSATLRVTGMLEYVNEEKKEIDVFILSEKGDLSTLKEKKSSDPIKAMRQGENNDLITCVIPKEVKFENCESLASLNEILQSREPLVPVVVNFEKKDGKLQTSLVKVLMDKDSFFDQVLEDYLGEEGVAEFEMLLSEDFEKQLEELLNETDEQKTA